MLELQNITKSFKNFELKSVNITINRGDYQVILGPSGSGKSMILELISGLQKPDSGNILFNGQDICQLPIQKREIGMLFQDFALFPHMSVFDNIAYSLKLKDHSKESIRQQVEKLAEQFELTGFLTRKPGTLSGGEAQRLALARTLATKPAILLLDEPLSSLDVSLRNNFRKILYRLNREGQTILHVTHDYEEAGILANKITVLHNGAVIQQGDAREVLNNPRSEFTARFCGYKNFFPAQISNDPAHEKSHIHIGDSPTVITYTPTCHDEKGFIIIDEKKINMTPGSTVDTKENRLPGVIREITPDNNFYDILIDAGLPLHVQLPRELFYQNRFKEKEPVTLTFGAEAIKFIQPQ